MIFRPIEPGKRAFGLMPWQGVFHKLRDEVCRDYAALLAKEILTPKAVMESLLTGPMSDKLFEMIQAEIAATVDDQAGIARPLVVMAIGGRKYRQKKQRMAQTVIERMQVVSAEEYEELLRPACRDDEKTVIAVGAILGFVVGELQAAILL